MSHYAVLVALPGETSSVEEAIEHVMLKFDENMKCDPRIDETIDEIMGKREKDVKAWTEVLKTEKDREQKKRLQEQITKTLGMTNEEYYEYQTDGYEKDEEGNTITTYNPDSKWDWYVIGGRWNNSITMTNGHKTNVTRVKSIRYEPSKEEIDEARKRYKNYQKQSKEKDRKKLTTDFVFSDFDKDMSEDDFIRMHTSFSYYSFVDKEGEWHERAEMGMFGFERVNDKSESRLEWQTKFKERFIDGLSPDDYLVVVDCHI